MGIDNSAESAKANLANLAALYPGRVLIAGVLEDSSRYFQIGVVMGRSTGSRNRIIKWGDGNTVRTEVYDSSLEKGDPKNTLYNIARNRGRYHVMSNGRQTDTYIRDQAQGLDVWESMRIHDYEDDPSHTSRITSVINAGGPFITLTRVATNPLDPRGQLNPFYSMYRFQVPEPGFGFVIQTYTGEGGTEPDKREPYLVYLAGDLEQVANTVWQTLNQDNKVALVAKSIQRGSDNYWFAPFKAARTGD